jgi:hypothetical protein
LLETARPVHEKTWLPAKTSTIQCRPVNPSFLFLIARSNRSFYLATRARSNTMISQMPTYQGSALVLNRHFDLNGGLGGKS